MDKTNQINIIVTNLEELKEAEEIYKSCLYFTEDDINGLRHPSLKFGLYNWNLNDAFNNRVSQIITAIEEIEVKLKNYKDGKVDLKKEEEQLKDYKNNLIKFKNESNSNRHYYQEYLIYTAKRADTLKTDTAKYVYLKTSEDIINIQIKFFLKCEKYFILIKEHLKEIKLYLK